MRGCTLVGRWERAGRRWGVAGGGELAGLAGEFVGRRRARDGNIAGRADGPKNAQKSER